MNLQKSLILILISAGFLSCSQWKVSSLQDKKILHLPAGVESSQISLRTTDNDLMDISFSVKVSRDRIFVADNKMKRLQVFDMDGSPDLVIGPKKSERAGQDQTVPFNFGLIGEMARDSEGKIYIQNRIDSGAPQALAAMTQPTQDDLETMPSYVLVFDNTGKLQYTMGQKGAADLPFYYIESISIDEKDRLFVVSKSLNSWNIFRFRAKGRDFYAKIGKDIFREKEGQDEFRGIIENIVPFRSGEKLLASVAFYHNTRFKYRKIYEYSIKDSSFGLPIFTIQDPKNELFSIMDDKYVLLWDTEEKDVRFVIWDFDSNIVNNLKVANDTKKSYYREIISDEAGKLYSYSARKTGLEISEWK